MGVRGEVNVLAEVDVGTLSLIVALVGTLIALVTLYVTAYPLGARVVYTETRTKIIGTNDPRLSLLFNGEPVQHEVWQYEAKFMVRGRRRRIDKLQNESPARIVLPQEKGTVLSTHLEGRLLPKTLGEKVTWGRVDEDGYTFFVDVAPLDPGKPLKAVMLYDGAADSVEMNFPGAVAGLPGGPKKRNEPKQPALTPSALRWITVGLALSLFAAPIGSLFSWLIDMTARLIAWDWAGD